MILFLRSLNGHTTRGYATYKQGEFVSGVEALAGQCWPAKASTPKRIALFLHSLNGCTARGYSQTCPEFVEGMAYFGCPSRPHHTPKSHSS
jgi:hypothetical protein